MERHDVQRELQSQIVRDAEGIRDLNFQPGEDLDLLTTRTDLLTLQVRTLKSNSKIFLGLFMALL